MKKSAPATEVTGARQHVGDASADDGMERRSLVQLEASRLIAALADYGIDPTPLSPGPDTSSHTVIADLPGSLLSKPGWDSPHGRSHHLVQMVSQVGFIQPQHRLHTWR